MKTVAMHKDPTDYDTAEACRERAMELEPLMKRARERASYADTAVDRRHDLEIAASYGQQISALLKRAEQLEAEAAAFALASADSERLH